MVVLEDVTTSGGSALQAVEAVRREGCEVDTVVTLLDRQEGAEKLLNSIGIRLRRHGTNYSSAKRRRFFYVGNTFTSL